MRVLVAEDSPTYRLMLKRLLISLPGIELLGVATNGLNAVSMAIKLAPDVLIADLEMPGLHGADAIRRIRREVPGIICIGIAVNLLSTAAQSAIKAKLFPVIEKPTGKGRRERFAKQLGEIVGLVFTKDEVSTSTTNWNQSKHQPQKFSRKPAKTKVLSTERSPELILVASSTGGPPVLETILRRLTNNLGCPIVVLQHLPAGFGPALVSSLQRCSDVPVQQAKPGQGLRPDRVFVAPGGVNIRIASTAKGLLFRTGATGSGTSPKPSTDVFLKSLPRDVAKNTVATILTGMGNDGAAGVRDLKEHGGRCIAQSRNSCVVYGMPRAVIENGDADLILDPNGIAEEILRLRSLRELANGKRVKSTE